MDGTAEGQNHQLRNLLGFLLLLLLTQVGYAQSIGTAAVTSSELIDADKPVVYLTFEKFGKRKPQYKGDTGEVVWLRLHNNSRWAIHIVTYSLHLEKDYVEKKTSRGLVRVIRDGIEVEPAYSAFHSNTGYVSGYGKGNWQRLYGETWIASGESLVVCVRREHLGNSYSIGISPSFEWEWRWKNGKPDREIDERGMTHTVGFAAWQLPLATVDGKSKK